MKNHDFINLNVGKKVYITGDGDLGMKRELRRLIFYKTELKLLKLTKAGMAHLYDEETKLKYSVPPRNVRLIGT